MRRRALFGQGLLVASSAVVLGCGTGAVSGNLVAPPMFELCVTVEPAEAVVTIDDVALEEDGCNSAWEGEHVVAATAEGFDPLEETVQLVEDTQLDLVLTPTL